MGDPNLLRLVIQNLLGNAWKFSRDRDPAEIEFARTLRDGKAAFVIRDNGVGFNMDYADKLFGAFQRLHARDEFEGTGVGLASVLRIVRRHGGTAWAESELGAGASFFFTLESYRKNADSDAP